MSERSFPCPRQGCGATAVVIDDDAFDAAIGRHLWVCSNGHHGPRLVLNQRIDVG